MRTLKWFLWALNVCLLGVGIFLGFKIYENKIIADENFRIAQAISQEEREMTKDCDCALQEGMIDQTFVAVAYPVDESKKVVGAVEVGMKAYVKEKFGTSNEVSKVRELAFIDAKSSDMELDKDKKYSLHTRRYRNEEKAVTKAEESKINRKIGKCAERG